MKKDHPITRLCAVMAVSRSGYHAQAAGRRNIRERRDDALRPKLRAAFDASRQTYGYPRMTVELRDQHEQVGKVRVARLRKEEGLCGRPLKRYRPQTTQSDHDDPITPNRLAEIQTITARDQVWQTDITYLPTAAGWLYLAVVIDACSKRVLGWAMGATLDTAVPLAALMMALRQRKPSPGLIHHSDRGVQYASADYRGALADHGLVAFMSRRGNCYDNAAMEAFWSSLKNEHVHRRRFATRADARTAIFNYIESFYNRSRRHSSLGYQSPLDYESSLS